MKEYSVSCKICGKTLPYNGIVCSDACRRLLTTILAIEDDYALPLIRDVDLNPHKKVMTFINAYELPILKIWSDRIKINFLSHEILAKFQKTFKENNIDFPKEKKTQSDTEIYFCFQCKNRKQTGNALFTCRIQKEPQQEECPSYEEKIPIQVPTLTLYFMRHFFATKHRPISWKIPNMDYLFAINEHGEERFLNIEGTNPASWPLDPFYDITVNNRSNTDVHQERTTIEVPASAVYEGICPTCSQPVMWDPFKALFRKGLEDHHHAI